MFRPLDFVSSTMSKLFGGKDPFDDPFFTRPFGGIFSGKNPFDDPFDYQSGSKKEIFIEELGSEDDTQKHSEGSKELVVNKNPNNESNGMYVVFFTSFVVFKLQWLSF